MQYTLLYSWIQGHLQSSYSPQLQKLRGELVLDVAGRIAFRLHLIPFFLSHLKYICPTVHVPDLESDKLDIVDIGLRGAQVA